MQMKRAFLHAVELDQAMFCIAPEALNSIDVVRSKREFIVAMIDSQMPIEAQIDQPVIASPTVSVHHRFQTGFATNNGL